MGTRAEPRAHQAAAPRPAQITPAQALYYTQFYRLKKSFNPSTTLCFLLIIRAKVAEGFDFLILQQGSAAISRNRYKRHHKQAVEQETAKAAKILGFIGDFGFWLFKNPRFHRRFCPFRRRASFRAFAAKCSVAKPPSGRSVAGIENSVPGLRAPNPGLARTGRQALRL